MDWTTRPPCDWTWCWDLVGFWGGSTTGVWRYPRACYMMEQLVGKLVRERMIIKRIFGA